VHYIVGTQITVTPSRKTPIRPGMSSSQIRSNSTGISSYKEQRELFDPGDTYTLIRVYVKGENVCYKFASLSGDITEVEFSSVADAENFISELRGESVPDYEKINRDKTD